MIKNTEKECQKAYSTQTHELNRMKYKFISFNRQKSKKRRKMKRKK